MKVTLNWLRQYVDFDWSPDELAERLTMIGIEVEGVQKVAGEFEGIVVAQVVTRDKVSGSDKLSVCRVNDGKGERQIICGANNFKAGDKVAMILPNFALPLKPGEKEPFVIKVRKVMGVESHGMLCSPQELGLPDQIDGILILREDAAVGQPFAEYLGRQGGDVVYDLEITPNRPDLNSVIGIAREISAVSGNPLKLPDLPEIPHSSLPRLRVGALRTLHSSELVAVRVDDAELCPRYTARVVRGVKIGPSPEWLKNRLESVGIRSISNVVDVTNFVMMECGQPLHAFDYHLIARGADGKPTIVVRRAADGEKFTTLDGQVRTLTNQMLLIADETKAIALAGVMGGQNTEINDRTADVLIESAYFKPQNIRATSKKLELRTESSYRFERGGDAGICNWASRRAAQLILETAGGELAEGAVDVYPHPVRRGEINLRHHKVCELLGVKLSSSQQVNYLERLGLKVCVDNAGEYCVVEIPTFRVDLKREVDLIEEIARMHGVDKIPSTPPRGAIGSNEFDAVHDQLAEARRILTGLGLNEAQGQTLVSDKSTGDLPAVPLANALSSDMNVLRPSLLPGLLDALRHNLSRKNNDVSLFEIGRVFTPPGAQPQEGRKDAAASDGQIPEERRVAIALTGRRNAQFWSGEDREAGCDTYDLKGVLEEFFENFGVRGITFARRPESTALYLESAAVRQGKLLVGEAGQLLPALARRYDVRDPVLLAELNLDLLLRWRNPDKKLKPLPAFPAIRRDVAMLVPEATTHEAVTNTVRQAKPANLESVLLFDVFRGQNVPAGQKSMAYAFTYRNPERTLTDAEVNAAHEKLVEALKRNVQATIR
jgi:phenylalanyl-tRNA synthetase beta chain